MVLERPGPASGLDCALLVRDVGDAQALAPLARALRAKGKSVRILALGQAASRMLLDDVQLADVVVAPDGLAGVTSRLGVAPGDLGGGQGHRQSFASPNDARALADALQAPLVVTGVVSRAQAEVVAALRAKAGHAGAVKIAGYYDSLALNRRCFLFDATTLGSGDVVGAGAARLGAHATFAAQLDELWVSLAGLQVGVALAAGISQDKLAVVGSPALDATLHQLAALEGKRHAIRVGKLGAEPQDQVTFYAGGRDAPGGTSYASSLATFVRAAVQAAPPARGRNLFVVGLHPASDGQLERDVLARYGARTVVRLVRTTANPVASEEVSTEELVAGSDVVATWNSTVASQAALLPRTGVVRRVVFVDGSQPADHFAVVEQGLAVQLQKPADLVRLLEEGRAAGLHPIGPASALPAQAVDAMLARLDALRQGQPG